MWCKPHYSLAETYHRDFQYQDAFVQKKKRNSFFFFFFALIRSVHFQIFVYVTTIRTCFDERTSNSFSSETRVGTIYIPCFTIDLIRMGLYLIGVLV